MFYRREALRSYMSTGLVKKQKDLIGISPWSLAGCGFRGVTDEYSREISSVAS